MRPMIIFIIMTTVISCADDDDTGGSPYSPPDEILLRIAAFTAQNGSNISGQVEVWKKNSNGEEMLKLLNDFNLSGVSGTIQFWLTDDIGSNNLTASTKKVLVDSLISNYSGSHIFDIPSGYTVTDFKYLIAFMVNGAHHIGKAQLLLPLPSG